VVGGRVAHTGFEAFAGEQSGPRMVDIRDGE